MHAEIVCPGCRRSYALTERVRGKTVRCRWCSTTFRVPVDGPSPPIWQANISQAAAYREKSSQDEIIYIAEEVPFAPEEPAAARTASARNRPPSSTRPGSAVRAAWVLSVERYPMPGTVKAAVVALLLLPVGELVIGCLNYSTSPMVILIRLGTAFPLCSALVIGICAGSRFAWFGCRLLIPLGGIVEALGITLLIVILAQLPVTAPPELLQSVFLVLGILIAESAALVIVFFNLGARSARRYLGLMCPACGSFRCRAVDLWFQIVHCRVCRHEWTAAPTARNGRMIHRDGTPAVP